jgi:hypothetical protein
MTLFDKCDIFVASLQNIPRTPAMMVLPMDAAADAVDPRWRFVDLAKSCAGSVSRVSAKKAALSPTPLRGRTAPPYQTCARRLWIFRQPLAGRPTVETNSKGWNQSRCKRVSLFPHFNLMRLTPYVIAGFDVCAQIKQQKRRFRASSQGNSGKLL